MHSENNKCSSLPSSYLLFLFSSRSDFSCLFPQHPLILSFLILCSLFYRLSTSSSLFLKSCHALFPRASYLFACRRFILFCFSPSSLLLYFLLSFFHCFPQYFLCVSPLMEECFSSNFIFSTIFSFFDPSLKTIYVFFFFFSFVFFPSSFLAPIIFNLVLFSVCSLQP